MLLTNVWLKALPGPVACMHIDCDPYFSTKTAFDPGYARQQAAMRIDPIEPASAKEGAL